MSDSLPPNIRKATILDGDGNPHEYTIVLHPPSEGEVIMWQLASVAGESLGGALMGLLSGGGIDSDLDLGALGRDLASAIRKTDMPDFRKAVLKHTVRDNAAIGHPDGIAFNAAYQANYGELLRALREVLRVNRLFPDPDTLAS